MSRETSSVKFADAKDRFSSRVADYLRYRPRYPQAVLDELQRECQITAADPIADVGSGTGFLAELFLQNGNPVFGVEPNKEMREAGEQYLQDYPRFTSVDGSAEATSLAPASVGFVTAGQAFHWFEPQAARREFERILHPNGWVVIIWQDRGAARTDFANAYEDLLVHYGTDYTRVKDSYPKKQDVQTFFGHDNLVIREVPNHQIFDLEGLRGRLRSSSYAPSEGHANFNPMMAGLDRLFATHQQHDQVRMDFSCWMYLGQLDPGNRRS